MTQVLVYWQKLTFSTIFRRIHAISSKIRIEINETVQRVMYFVKKQAPSQTLSKLKWLFVRRSFIVQSCQAISVSEIFNQTIFPSTRGSKEYCILPVREIFLSKKMNVCRHIFNTLIFLETKLSHKQNVLFCGPLYFFGKYQLRFPNEFWRDIKRIQIAKYDHKGFQSLDRFWAAKFYTFQEQSITLSEPPWRVKNFIFIVYKL